MKNIKKLLAIFMTIVCCFTFTVTALAAGPTEDEYIDEEYETRMNGYLNHYHSASSYYEEYTMTTEWALFTQKQATINLSDFNSNSWIIVEIYNSNGRLCLTLDTTGNGNHENLQMNPLYYTNGGTYTIKVQVFNSNHTPSYTDDGWIGIWIY